MVMFDLDALAEIFGLEKSADELTDLVEALDRCWISARKPWDSFRYQPFGAIEDVFKQFEDPRNEEPEAAELAIHRLAKPATRLLLKFVREVPTTGEPNSLIVDIRDIVYDAAVRFIESCERREFEEVRKRKLDRDVLGLANWQDAITALNRLRTKRPTRVVQAKSDRAMLVDAFIKKYRQATGLKTFKTHIWKAAGHSWARQFQYWQTRDPKATEADDQNFTRILEMRPAEFKDLLEKMDII